MRRLVGLAVVGLATLAPTWAHADDEQIAQEIIQKLEAKKDAGLMKGFGIDLEVEDGTVILKGVVATTDQRNLALDIARRVKGVEKVVNGLTLKPMPASSAKDGFKSSPAEPMSAEPRSIELTTSPREVDAEEVSVPEFQPIAPRPVAAMSLPAQPFSPPELEAMPISKSKMRSSSVSPAQAAAKSPEQLWEEPKASQKTSSKGGFFSSLSKTISSALGDSTANESTPIRQVTHTDPELTEKPVTRASASLPAETADDDRIVNVLSNELRQEKLAGRLKGFHIDAKSTNGKLVVSGHVSSYDQHMLVIEKARRIRGVKQVVNDLKVTASIERIANAERNDPSTPSPEGTGVAKRATRTAPYVESVPVPVADNVPGSSVSSRQPLSSGPSALNARMSGTAPVDPATGAPQGMRAVPMPVQFVPVQMQGMPPQYAGMVPPQYAGMPPQYAGMPPQYAGMPPQYAGMVPPQYAGMPQQYGGMQPYRGMPQTPLAFAPSQAGQAGQTMQAQGMAPAGNQGPPMPTAMPSPGGGIAPARYDHPNMPGYAWPSYAAYPNYAAVTYPKQYSPSAWPYIGPFYPYPQVPLGWRKVSLEWDDGWWMLDFKDKH